MNKAQQIHRVEHSLKQIEGNTIVASKKKRKTFALKSNEHNAESSEATYTFPATYISFQKTIEDACEKGDGDSKKVIEKLAPHMAITLKEKEKWDQPDVPLEDVPLAMKRVTNLSEVKPLDPEKIDAVMEKELGELECELSSTATTEEERDESRHALANMLVDIDISGANEVMKVSSLQKTLSGLQPQREVPNKNRGKRFAAGELTLDKSTIDSDHQVQDLQFWTLHSTTKALVSAKVFLLGEVCLVL